jgi:hypothetical protein
LSIARPSLFILRESGKEFQETTNAFFLGKRTFAAAFGLDYDHHQRLRRYNPR